MVKLRKLLEYLYRRLDYLTVFFIILYTTAATVVSLNRYWQYQSYYFDFGIFDRAIWQVAHFQLPLVDHFVLGDKAVISFADHFNPSVFLLSPLYWLTDKREILLVAQSVVVGLSALVAFFISKAHLKNKLATFSLIFAYLGYVGLQNALITDFHETTLLSLPLMILFWSIFNNRWRVYFPMLIIILGLKESFTGLGAMLGLFLLIRYKRKYLKQALFTISLSIVWALVAIKLIIPYFSQGVYIYSPVITGVSIDWNAVVFTLLTFGFLPLLDLSILPAIAENFFERFVLLPGKSKGLAFHYNAPLSPLMFIGGLFAFQKLEKRSFKIESIVALLIILTVFVLHRKVLNGPLGLFYNGAFYEQNQRVKYVDDFVAKFPQNGLIMTQNDLAVRLTHQDVKLLRRDYKSIDPDYVILNLTPGQNPNSFFPISFEDTVILKEELLRDNNYSLKKFAQDQYIFSKI
jgi:uncharacterized membrane protein